jgi:hypothetical protein
VTRFPKLYFHSWIFFKNSNKFANTMRLVVLYCSLILCIAANGQVKDTIFLRRRLADTPYTFYNAVYIDKAYDFKRRGSLTDFSFNHFDSATYSGELQNLKPIKSRFKLMRDFPANWILLYQYKGEYFTYEPSERGEEFKFRINDSTTIDYTMEGPEPSRITGIQQLSATQLIITRNNLWKDRVVKINIVDPARGIGVFTFGPTAFKRAGQKLLMVSAEKAPLFRTIVNFCMTDKVSEFDFDIINFKKLEK